MSETLRHMAQRMPLSTLLSQLLIAFTIELDNEFEHRFVRAGGGARVASVVVWSNFLRFVGEGMTVGELPAATGTSKARVRSILGGLERWRYISVAPPARPGSAKRKREGYGSGRGLESDWVVRLTEPGRKAAAIWPELFPEIEGRWEERLGAERVSGLRISLRAVVDRIDTDLPEHPPIVTSTNGMALDLPPLARRAASGDLKLLSQLSQALIAYTLDFERESELSLPLSANVIRVVDEAGVLVRDLPRLSGTSKEAVAMAMTYLAKTDHTVVEGSSAAAKHIRLTPSGRELRDGYAGLQSAIEQKWKERFGADEVGRLRSSLEDLIGDAASLARGLEPYPEGWRASKPYLERTRAVLADPHAGLPHHPVVLPRGGWPDGS